LEPWRPDRTRAGEAGTGSADFGLRIGGYHLHDEVARELFELGRAAAICSAVFDRPAVPRFSITFGKGSQQALHQDTAVFHVSPRNFLAGVWIACEDIRPEAGPLVYYPGSHREPMFPGYDNYPQTNRRTAPPEELPLYDAYVAERARPHPRQEFLARAGDALFWHGMLIHGGAPVRDRAATHMSFVVHYMPDGVDQSDVVVGPFNW
jgi:ectoine hydroxylase-related dioxygenase (phytanoyl-CoA dioxygenase family)